jgi:transcriptional regulator with XRE-family HTH domain
MKTLGKKVRLLRQLREWNQEDMAQQLDISIPAYSKIESGITDMSLSRLVQIAGLFNLTPIELLEYGEEKDTSEERELEAMVHTLNEQEQQIIGLQKKVISLYEELWSQDKPEWWS